MSSTCRTRPPRGEPNHDAVVRDPDAVGAHLEDAAHYPGGHAAGVAYPRSEADVARLVLTNARVLPIGAQSSLTGGATPFGDVVLSMSRMNAVLAAGTSRIVVQPGATLDTVAAALRPHGAAFPPTPTFTGATAGGAVATNAAGAATFKYGSMRDWVEGLTVVLANGEALDLVRGDCRTDDSGFVIDTAAGPIRVPLPTYEMPNVVKRSAGYFAAPGMDLVDLFVGSEGTLGVITEVTLRAHAPAPALAVALVFCPSDRTAVDLAGALRTASRDTWRSRDPSGLDVCAIEYVDDRSLALVAASRARGATAIAVPAGAAAALLVQLELAPGTTPNETWTQIWSTHHDAGPDSGLTQFTRILERLDLLDATTIAAPGDAFADELLRFRESVPAAVNQLVGAAKRGIDPRIEKTAADMVVPFERFAEMMDVYRRGFERHGLDFAIWGHISDGNVHPNVIPRSFDDVVRGKEAILEFGRDVARLGGCPLAEHGVGRNPVKQELLRQLYGDAGIEQMRAVKRALDPEWKLATGVIFPV